MNKGLTLQQVVTLHGRFYRSVQLVRDYTDPRLRESYLVTPTVRKIARRILGALAEPTGARAWSLVGPFGTGKSSFVLYLLDVLTGARSAPDSAPGQLEFGRPRLLPVLVVGERAPLRPSLLKGLAKALEPLNVDLAQECLALAEAASLSDQATLNAFERALKCIQSGSSQQGSSAQELRTSARGLVIAVDELGKFLEFAAHNPDQEDLFILQGLAELSARSPNRLMLITVLHSALTDYLKGRDDVRLAEWLKVQGRFAEQSFIESHEQLLTLIGQAIRLDFPPALNTAYLQAVDSCLQSPSLKEAGARYALPELLPALLPLHPLTALLLPGLFKSKLAQNERSLFTFLTSHEPDGFLDFLEHTPARADAPELYRVDRLYDYVRSALGAATYRGEHSRRWAEVEQALERVGRTAPSQARSVVKTVGLLSLHGASAGLKASREVLELSLGDSPSLAEALEYLEKQSILIYRRHEGGYGLWEGSDVDLDAAHRKAQESTANSDVAHRLNEQLGARPWLARAHSFHTGALRGFETRVVQAEVEDLEATLGSLKLELEGCIAFVLVRNKQQAERAVAEAVAFTRAAQGLARLRIVAIPKPLKGLSEAMHELEAWRYVEQNTPELKGDPVARREVQARLQFAQEHLEAITGETFGVRGYLFRPELSTWVQGGVRHSPASSHAFMRWLSEVCDDVFEQTPLLHNELLNRNTLSAASVKARNLLLKAMLAHPHQLRLGMEGTPPEVSMYESVLVRSGLHRERSGQYCFGPPEHRQATGSWWPVWQEMEAFLASTRTGRRPVLALYEKLKTPPFGLKEGPLPVLFLAHILARGNEVALYKQGMFVPELREETLELLARNPKDFEVQLFAFGPEERRVLQAIRSAIGLAGLGTHGESLELATVARDLIAPVARLSAYARNTRRISPRAQRLRELLLNAREPVKLLLEDLPALMAQPDSSEADIPMTMQAALQACLTELLRAYPALLDELERQLRGAFSLTGDYREAREQLRQRFQHLLSFRADVSVSAFIRETARASEGDWRENLARVIHRGQPPSSWQDHDVAQFMHRLDILASDLTRLEELAAEKKQAPTAQVFRLGLLAGDAQEARAVVAVPPELLPDVEGLKARVAALLENHASASSGTLPLSPEQRRQIQLAVLAQLAAELMQRPQ